MNQTDLNDGRERHEIRRTLFGIALPTRQQRQEWAKVQAERQNEAERYATGNAEPSRYQLPHR